MPLRLFLGFIVLAASLNAGTIPGLTSRKLANGLEVIVIENHAVPLVTVEIAVKSGSFVESPEYSGLSHLYEHMFFKANRTIPNAEKYQERLRELGASWNGTTQTERVNYFLTVPSENLRESTAFLRDALFQPLFQQKELERERVVVLGEFDRAEANPNFHLFREVDRKVWKHLSRKNVIGDREVIVTTPREKMVTIKNRYYVPNNSAVLFAGDVKPEEAYALADEFFASWKPTENPHKLYPEPAQPPLERSSALAVIGPVQTVTVHRVWHGPGLLADTPSTFAADVFSFIISQPSSRFYRKLIDSGLFDRASLSYFSQVHTGPISVDAVTAADRFDRAQAALNEEIQHMADDDYFTDEELEFAKNQLEVSEIYGRERTSNFVHTVSFWWASASLKYYEDYVDNLRKTSRADVQNYLRRYVLGKPSVTGVLLADGDLAKISSLKNAEVIRPKSGSSATAMASTSSTNAATERFDVDGVRVLLRTNPQSEIVAAKAFLQGGVAYAGQDRSGLELLLLQVAEKQSRNYPKEKMARELTRLGARLQSQANVDESELSVVSLRRNFPESFTIFLDALVHPLFTDSEVALARERRLTAISNEEDSPDLLLNRLATENAYGNHPYGLNPLGTRERIKSVSAADLQKLHAGTVNRSRLLLVIVGNVTKDEATKLIRPAIADLPEGEFAPAKLPSIPDTDRQTTKRVSRDLPTVYIEGLFAAASPADPDYAPFYVGMAVLRDHLFKEVRIKRNLSYAPGAWTFRRAANVGAVYVTTPRPNEALAVISEEIRRMQTAPISEKELRDSANSVRTGMLQNMQAAEDVAAWLGTFELRAGGWEKGDEFLSRLNSVTPEDVRQAMNKYANKIDFALVGKLDGFDEKVLANF